MTHELILMLTVYLAGFLANQLRLPPLVGYLGAGYLLAYTETPVSGVIHHLAEFGIELLLFTVGLKLNLASLLRKEVLGVGSMHMLIVTLGTGLGFLLLDRQVTGGLLLGASLAFSSTVLAVKILEDNSELSSLHGRVSLGILIFQDIVAVGLLALAHGERPTLWSLSLLLLPLLRGLAFKLFDAHRDDELKLLFGIILALSGGAFAQAVGISEDLGALAMGALLAGHADSKGLAGKLWALKEIFLIAFFLEIGLSGVPTVSEFQTALALVSLLPVQGVLFFFLFLLVGLRARTAFVTALSLMTYSEFALITSQVITEAGLLPLGWTAVMGVAVALSLALAAPLNRFSHRLYGWLEPALIRFEMRGKHPDRTPTAVGRAQWLVMGMGRTGKAAYETLERHNYHVVGLDADPTRLEFHRESNRRVLYGDAEDPTLWENLHSSGLRGVIIALPDLSARQSAAQHLRANGFQGLIGSTSYHAREDAVLLQTGVDVLFHPLTEAGERLAEKMLETDRGST
ncbi:MAG: cation:proton antiporter [Methylococcaceae bacterium]